MSPSDRSEVEFLLDRLRTSSIPGVDNIAEIVKERDELYIYVKGRADRGDNEAKALIMEVTMPLPHRF